MTKKMAKGYRFLLLCAVVFAVALLPQKVQAAVTPVKNGSVYMTDTQGGTDTPLYGRLSINYTGNSNYECTSWNYVTQYNTYDSSDDQYKAAKKVLKNADSVIGKNIKNNRSATLTKSSGADGTIRAAYLVWQARTSVNRSVADAKELANSQIALVTPDKTAKLITAKYAAYDVRAVSYQSGSTTESDKQYTFVTMYADVTSIINSCTKKYGTYSVFNIPYYDKIGGGAGNGGWQLVVVENCDSTVPMRAVRLKMGAQFNIDDVANQSGHWKELNIKTGLNSAIKSKAYKEKDTEPITGQLLYICATSGSDGNMDMKKLNLYAAKTSGTLNSDTLIYKTEDSLTPYLCKNGTALYTKATSTRGNLIDFSLAKKSSNPAYGKKNYTLVSNTGNDGTWITMFVTGIAIDIADNFATGDQVTTVNSSTSVTVSQKITNNTLQTKTGYYNGKLVVTLDEALTPTNKTPELTIYNKEDDTTTKIKGTWNTSKHTMTFSTDSQGGVTSYAKSKFKNPSKNSYISYSIDCIYAKNSGVKEFTNSFLLSGDLRSQSEETKTTISNIFDGTSTAVPKYTLTIEMDKASMKQIVAKQGASKANTALGTISTSSTAIKDSSGNVTGYKASYDITYDYYISAAPTFANYYEFSKWVELNEKENTSADRKVTSKYVNDSTYAYERQMPAYNITISITATAKKYEIRYYINAPGTLTANDSWKIYTGDHLIGKSSAETATVTYTGTQINSACGSNKPYVYRTYTCEKYVSAPQSSNIKINKYSVVISGTHTKNGWWTAASGGTYVNIDGETSGDNAGKISATDLWQYAVDGTLSDGTKGKIVSLYAHWEKSSFKVTLTAGTGVESVSGAGNYKVGDKVKISADLKNGYHWLNWTGNYASGTIADQTFTFTMPAQDVTLTANAEINSYTLHFDPNTGTEVTHIDDMEVTYDGQITLPDATGCYARYTLDGQDITSQVISGEIRLAADGRVLTDEEEIEDTEESDTETVETPKKSYASVYTGWSLEEGKINYTPQWGYGIKMDAAQIIDAAGMTDTDGATITLYANWDDCPWIVANDLYYTLEQAQSGYITLDEILSHATASDREDGSPILPGTNQAESNPELFTSFTIPDYSPTDFTQFTGNGSCTENLTVTDSAGSTYAKQITVYIVDTTAKEISDRTRFIDEFYYNQPYELGGLEEDSIWKTDTDYAAALQEAFSNLNNNTPEERYVFTHETILEMKQFIEENGFANTKSEDALARFYYRFMEPNEQ